MSRALTTGKRGAIDPRYELTEHYDVRSCRNGLIVGSVRYSFHDGTYFCIAVLLHADLPAWARSVTEYGPFEMHEGEAPWGLPVAGRPSAASLALPSSSPALLPSPSEPDSSPTL